MFIPCYSFALYKSFAIASSLLRRRLEPLQFHTDAVYLVQQKLILIEVGFSCVFRLVAYTVSHALLKNSLTCAGEKVPSVQ